MEDVIKLEIISPEKILVDTTVEKVILPGVVGSFEVLRSHAPLITSLEAGTIKYTSKGKDERLEIKSGFVEVLKNTVSVCVEV